MRRLAPSGRDAESFRARMRAEKRYEDVLVIEVIGETIGFLTRQDVDLQYGGLSYTGCPVPSAVKPGTWLRLWGRLGLVVLGGSLLVTPPIEALLSSYSITGVLPTAIEGEHLWLREP